MTLTIDLAPEGQKLKGTPLWLLLLLGCAVFARGQLPPGSGPIQDLSDSKRGRLSGEVRDENGNPVPNAVVQATPHDVILMTILPNTRTDAQGRFVLAGLLRVRTHLNAGKEDAFYPDARSNFWDDPGAAEVEVPAGGALSGVSIKLTPAGRLNVRAKNAITGEPVDAITVHLERVGSPNRSISGSSLGNSWLVPTAPVRVRVQARGFQPAWYGADGSIERSEAITLSPRQILTIVIALSPLQ